jgi:GcrA cell cycle regulator
MTQWKKPLTDREASVLALFETGMPTAEIGRILGITKNAVIGAAHRGRKKKDPRAVARPSRGRPKPLPPPVAVELPPPSLALLIPHVQATRAQCRYFCEGSTGRLGIVCGAQVVDGTSWCPDHYRVVFVMPRARPIPKRRAA